MQNPKTDINCDMGESYGNFKVGQDEAIFPYITSCNVACGFHGGDPLHIEQTIKQAIQHKVKIGAHTSYPDLQGFGRRKMQIKAEELKAIIKYQIAVIQGLSESLGGKMSYVKPHGALYNSMADNEEEALVVIRAIQEFNPNLALMGLAGSLVEDIAKQEKIEFIAEAFADRRYNSQGKLASRNQANAVITNPAEAQKQVLSIIEKQEVETIEGNLIKITAQSICVHGDNPAVLEILKALQMK